MAIELPAILQKFDLIVNGQGNAGKVDEFVFPKQVRKKATYNAGGLNSELNIPVGWEPMETSFKLTGLGDSILAADDTCALDGTTLRFLGNEKTISGCKNRTIDIRIRGNIKEWDPGSIKRGEINVMSASMDVTYIKFMRDGKTILLRDDLKGIYQIHGKAAG